MCANEGVVSKPRYSIICTLRNNYKCFYAELLDHIVSQTENNYECIFILDERDVDWVKVPDARFKIIRLETQLPLAQKRNIGIKNAIGEYIVFCDADDYLDKELLYSFSKIIDQYSPDLIIPEVSRNAQDFKCQNQHSIDELNLVNKKERIIDTFFSRYLTTSAQSKFLLDACWGRAFKREILINNGIYFYEEPCRAEDALFVNDFVVCATSVYFVAGYVGYYWRLNENSEMFNVNSFFFNIVPFANKLSQQLNNVPEIYSKDLHYFISHLVISQALIFCKARFEKRIDKATFVSLLNNSAPRKSFCRECLKKTSWKYGIKNKVLCLMYSISFYSMVYFLFYIRQRPRK